MAAPSLAEDIATAYNNYPTGHYERLSAITPLAKALALRQIKFEGPEIKHINGLLGDHPDFSPELTKATFRFYRVLRHEETELRATLLASTVQTAGKSRKSKARVQLAKDRARLAIHTPFDQDGRQQSFTAQVETLYGDGAILNKRRQRHQTANQGEEQMALHDDTGNLWAKQIRNHEEMKLAGVPTEPKALREPPAKGESAENDQDLERA